MPVAMNIYCLIVIYNKNYKDSLTYQSIKDEENINIIICDNSTSDQGNKELSGVKNITYIDMEGNKGLSKAYNLGIDRIKDKTGILCLFDDDTAIPADYFLKVAAHKIVDDGDILLPLVFDDVGMMSPGVMRKYLCYRAQSLDELVGDEFTGINSGMVIDLDIFANYRYDENIFLDYIDHNFIRDMRRQNKKILIMEDIVLHQTFSDVVNSKDSALIRYKILKKDLKYFYRETFSTRLFYYYVIGKRAIKLSLKYKTLAFLGVN